MRPRAVLLNVKPVTHSVKGLHLLTGVSPSVVLVCTSGPQGSEVMAAVLVVVVTNMACFVTERMWRCAGWERRSSVIVCVCVSYGLGQKLSVKHPHLHTFCCV